MEIHYGAGTILFFLSCLGVCCGHVPISYKQRLILLGTPATWNNAAEYCDLTGGSLMSERSASLTTMLNRYRETEWYGVWNGTKAWLGLFVEDINIPKFSWIRNCKSVSAASYNLFGTYPSSNELQDDQLCVYKDFYDDSWNFADCSSKLNAVCAENLGQCTYQRGTEENVCLKEISTIDITSANSQDHCEEICSNIAGSGNGWCWGVTYIPFTQTCVPSVSTDPHAFDHTNSEMYENPCTNPLVASVSNKTSVVSWRRCFDDPQYDMGLIPDLYPDENIPLHSCGEAMSTQPTIGYIQEFIYPPTTQKRRLILLTEHATFSDAAIFCKSAHNGTLLTHDSRAVGALIVSYTTNEWKDWPDVVFWDGVFLSDINVPLITYQGNCSVVNVNAFHRFDFLPLPQTLNPSSQCVKGDIEDELWYFERCGTTLSAICEQRIGPCTFERDSGNYSCVISSQPAENIYVENLLECERYCLMLEPEVWTKGECWAVTYLPESGQCIPAINQDPRHFDKWTTEFENPCQEDSIFNASEVSSVVSWKRCFLDPLYDTSDIPEETEDDEETYLCSAATGSIPESTSIPQSIATGSIPESTSILQSAATGSIPESTSIPQPTATGSIPESTSIPQSTTTGSLPESTSIPQLAATGPTPESTSIPQSTATGSIPESTSIPQTTTGPLPESTSIPLLAATGPTPESATLPLSTTTDLSLESITNLTSEITSLASLSMTTVSTTLGPFAAKPPPMATKSPGDPTCSCTCVVNMNMTLQEKTAALKQALSMNKEETSAHVRALTSADDDRPSAVGVGMTMGVGMLVGSLMIISLGDIISVVKFLYIRLLK